MHGGNRSCRLAQRAALFTQHAQHAGQHCSLHALLLWPSSVHRIITFTGKFAGEKCCHLTLGSRLALPTWKETPTMSTPRAAAAARMPGASATSAPYLVPRQQRALASSARMRSSTLASECQCASFSISPDESAVVIATRRAAACRICSNHAMDDKPLTDFLSLATLNWKRWHQ